ncbi:hypothetical protein CEP54_013099 [Fusarium duplospermum]|uniref:Peptidase S8/S53 domain-containing protein n=1 Tax=Fusarium duplospermum TaxID=1325734 RepID=A0A428P4Z6_9HYPO|nr:hypothetical protein CEP54_013099 [Fusarium duplospermum]
MSSNNVQLILPSAPNRDPLPRAVHNVIPREPDFTIPSLLAIHVSDRLNILYHHSPADLTGTMVGSGKWPNNGPDDENVYPTPQASEDGDTDDQPEARPLATLEQELAVGKWNLYEEPDKLRVKFYHEHQDTVRCKGNQDSNIFHVLARIPEKKIRKLKLLVYWVVQISGDLLTHTDTQGLTGFHLAIQNRNYRMVRYVLDAHEHYRAKKGWDIDGILKAAQNGNNSLHLAMKWMTPVPQKEGGWLETIKTLIDKASAETLTMQNQDGFTPLHLAVEGKKCTPQQLIIVKKLIETCEAALDVRGNKGKTDLSPYQYQQATYEEFRRKQPKQLGDRKTGHGASSTQNTDMQCSKTDDGRAESAAESAQGDVSYQPVQSREKPRGGGEDGSNGPMPAQRPSEGPSSGHARKPREGEQDGRGSYQEQKHNSGGVSGHGSNMKKLRRQPTVGEEAKDAGGVIAIVSQDQHQHEQMSPMATTAQKAIRHKDGSKTKAESFNDNVTGDSADEIASYLKRTYLRKRSRCKALDFLYGGVSDTQVDFNLYGKEGEISEEDFKRGYKCAKLEDTLQFVRIPHLIIKPTPPAPSASEPDDHLERHPELPSSKDPALGRTDLGIIFRWLRADARVEKIIKLIVDDSRDPPHCDEEIENAVKPFGVEVWDWCKIDLCCETIAKTAPNARQINLYWSGKNAVLRGWSDREGGLARLPDLEQVVVFLRSVSSTEQLMKLTIDEVTQGTEGRSRNLKNFSSFKERLERWAQRKDIRIKLAESDSNRQAIHTARVKNENALQNHRWLKCMDSFSHFIVNVRLRQPLQPIKIAIIDDGIDTTDRKLHDRIIGGQYFCAQDESPSFCVSAGGHGTMMARLITRVFPQAKIISLKLDEHAQSDGSAQFSVQSAADAVRYARSLGVSIINMSWSIEPTEASKNSLDDLRRAINLAEESKILMFCSANDQGKTEDKSYPGQCSRGPLGTLCKIGAATATGGEYHYVSLGDVDFLFPGRVVEKEQDEDAADNAAGTGLKDRSAEGSSLATAFASGLAGLILYILQLVSVYCEGDGGELGGGFAMHYESVRNEPSKMMEIFKRLATEKKFVEVWKVFENAEEALRTGGRLPDNKFRILTKICSELLTGLN